MKSASNSPSMASRTISSPALPRAVLWVTRRPSSRARSTPRSMIRNASTSDFGGPLAVSVSDSSTVEESHGHGRGEEAHHRVEEIGIEGAAVVGQKQALDAVPASARLGRENPENPVSPHI